MFNVVHIDKIAINAIL